VYPSPYASIRIAKDLRDSIPEVPLPIRVIRVHQ
jgi:hypothetical protein